MFPKFTCINCRVAFGDDAIQRLHYKTDWHRYNLKRKVAELPSVTAEEFHRRVLLQRQEDESKEKDTSVHCKVCHKMFSSSKSFENHLRSKKHISLFESQSQDLTNPIDCQVEEVSGKSKSTTNDSIEELDSEEWEDDNEDNPITRNDCLFCSHHSASFTKNVKHMTTSHSFFIPDIEYLIDLRGLLYHLGEKISKGYMCVWCTDGGREFTSMEAVQQHMVDKGHCKMIHEGEKLFEYSDYYDYSTSYPDNMADDDNVLFGNEAIDKEINISTIDDGGYQLVLPSGSVIGHRSLMRYYK